MNVVVICLDTLRWDALGVYNPSWVRTPAIDHYAQRATRFDAAYCASFPTVPMRVDAYTGDVNWPRYGWKPMDAGQPRLPSLLRAGGYYTGLVLDTANNVGAGLHTLYDDYVWIKKDVEDHIRPRDISFPVPQENLRQNGWGYARDMSDMAHYRRERDWFVARTMQSACDWLEDQGTGQPFFLWVDTFEIHEVWNPPSHYVDLYSPGCQGRDYAYPNYGYTDIYTPDELARMRARYAGEVTLTDRWVGHLLRQIEVMGLFANTTVILVSDHGMYLGEHGRAGKHTVDPADPWPLYDTVARLPLLVWSPFEHAPARVSALCQAADIMPTVLDLCGLEPVATVGRSWVPLLKGEGGGGHEAIFTSCHSGLGPGRIAYLTSLINVTTATFTGVFGPQGHRPELYDRLADPGQTIDVAQDLPDIVRALREKLIRFMEEQGAEPDYIAAYARGE